MLVMIGYIFMFKMVKKMQNSGLETVARLTPPLKVAYMLKHVIALWKQCAL